MKKYLRILLLLFLNMAADVASAYHTYIDGIFYSIMANDEAAVTYKPKGDYHSSYSGAVVIPKSITYDGKTYSVTTIYPKAFSGCSDITSITIPNSITYIGDYAFESCNGLQKVIIPDIAAWCGISIDSNPLYYAHHLYSDKDTEITDLIIPSGVTTIGNKLFAYCSGLTSVTIPNSVTNIGEKAFSYCSGLTAITFGSSVTSIEKDVFYGCSNLQKVIVPDLTAWCGFSFSNNEANPLNYAHHLYKDASTEIFSLEIPTDVTSISESAFCGCSYLKSVIIPNSVTTIGVRAFHNTRLNSVTIGAGVLSISGVLFSYDSPSAGCKPIKVIWLTNTPPNGYVLAEGKINYVANNLYSSLNDKIVYPFLSSIFEVGGVKYVPVSPSERTCDAIDCNYDNSAEYIHISEKTSYKGIELDVKNVQPYVCYNNSYIKKVIVEHNGNLSKYAFCDCNNITSATLSNQGNIGEFAFANSKINGTLTINNAGHIEMSAFRNITGSYTAIINNIGSIYASAFNNSTGLKRLEISNNVTNVVDSAFYCCTGISTATISNQGSIGNNVFYGCTGLTSVTISNRGDLGEHAFANSKINGTLRVNNTGNIKTSAFRNIAGSFTANINNAGNIYTSAFNNGTGLTKLEIGDNVTNLGDSTFYGCTHISQSVTISNRGSIGEFAFANSKINGTLKIINSGNIKASAFRNITGSFSANINNTGSLGVSVFDSSAGVTTLEIGNNVTNLGDNAFKSCSKLQTAKINNKGTLGNNVFQSCSDLRTATLANSIASVGQYAFDGCSSLQSIDIPNSVTNIGAYAFQNCSKMKSAKIGTGVKTIPNYTFSGCSLLADIQIGTSVKTVSTYAFSGCSSLPTIQIPQNVTTIADNVFNDCTSLKTVLMDDGEGELSLGSNGSSPLFVSCPLDSVYIGRNITYPTASSKGYSPFYRNTSLRSVAITDREMEISMNEFYGCTKLKNVRIGDSVTTIGDWAFSGCSSLDYFSFGSSVESIGKEAFSDCTAMTSLISRAETPPTCGSQALDDINKWECTLMVPDGYVAAYQAAPQWKEFFFVEVDPDGINEIKNESLTPALSKGEGDWYSLDGRKMVNGKLSNGKLPRGINIIRYADGTSKKVLIK